MLRPDRCQNITQHVRVDPARRDRRIGSAVPTPRARRQAHIRDTTDPDRGAQAIDHIKESIRPRGETVIHLAPEPAKFTLASPPRLHDTTNNGHLILPDKIRLLPQRVSRLPLTASPSTERLITTRTLNAKLRGRS